jgi:EmrB/QacA subfamily drug resistance transporter
VTPVPQAVNKTAILLIVVMSYLMIIVDVSVVITALPAIQGAFRFSQAELSLVHSAYTLTLGGLLLLGARAGDLLGHRRVVMAGLGLFTLASLLIGLSQGAGLLLAGRVLQGLGAAMLVPTTLAMLSTHFAEGPERMRAFSLHAAAAGVGTSLGLVLGGLAADLLSWRACFFINLPIGMLLLWATHRHVAPTAAKVGQFDLPGAVLSTLGMVALVFGLVRSSELGWADAGVATALLGAALALVLLVRHEARATQPIVPLRLFASPSRNAALAARLLFLGAMIGFWFFTTQYLQRLLGLSPLQAGLAFVPTTVVHFIAAMAVPRLSQRWGHPKVLVLGLSLSMCALIWLSLLAGSQPPLASLAAPMALIGLAQGLVFSPLTSAGVAGVDKADAGAASGLVNVAHQLGGAVGLSLLVVVYSHVTRQLGPQPLAAAQGIAATYRGGALMLAAALALTLLFIVRRPAHRASSISH